MGDVRVACVAHLFVVGVFGKGESMANIQGLSAANMTPCAPSMDAARAALSTYYGYEAFRQGQEVLIGAVLSGRDALGIMPTGAGKSLCYQIPGIVLPGLALVISPLVSLMKDQVNALIDAGVRGAFLNSTLTPGQQRTVLARAEAGTYKIMYVAPSVWPIRYSKSSRAASKFPLSPLTRPIACLNGAKIFALPILASLISSKACRSDRRHRAYRHGDR